MNLNNVYYVKKNKYYTYSGKYGNKVSESLDIITLCFDDGVTKNFYLNETISCEYIPKALLCILMGCEIGLFEEFYFNGRWYHFTNFGSMIDSETHAKATSKDTLFVLCNPDSVIRYKKKYWYIDPSEFSLIYTENINSCTDRYNFLCGNVYNTEEEAQKEVENMKRKLKCFKKNKKEKQK